MARRPPEREPGAPLLPAAKPPIGLGRLSVASLALLVAGLSVVGAATRPVGRKQQAPVPRKPVDLSRYLGLWYEFARYEVWFERGREGVTAEYSLRPDGLIRIVNVAHEGSPEGPIRWAEARGRVVPGSGQAKLRVAFFGPFFFGNYWVLDHAEDYSWAIVGERSRRYFWILTRAPHPPADLRARLLAEAQALGYDIGRLHLTRHAPAGNS